MGKNQPRKRRGRPVGSVSLTPEKADAMVEFVRGGATYSEAAALVGYTPRTVLEWIARGLGNSSRSSTPKLAEFARRMEQAKAEARVTAKVDLKGKSPGAWIRLADEEEAEQVPTAVGPEELLELFLQLFPHLVEDPSFVVPRCSNRRCRCELHRPRAIKEEAS